MSNFRKHVTFFEKDFLKKTSWINTSLSFFASILITLPFLPKIHPIPARDGGVFEYIGWRMLYGEIPYKDIWDHKGPIIYFLNFLGQLVTNSSLGIWIITFLAVFITLLTCFQLFSKIFNYKSAFFGFTIVALNIQILGADLHYVELFALPFQALVFYMFFIKKSYQSFFLSFLSGIFLSIVFFLKPNLIGIWIAIFFYVLIFEFKLKLKLATSYLSGQLLGFGIITLSILYYFFSRSALTEFINNYFLYNLAYSKASSPIKFLKSLSDGFIYLNTSKTLYFVVSGLLIFLILKIMENQFKEREEKLLTFTFILFFIEMVLSILSDKSYVHYYITWIIPVSIFSSYFIVFIDRKNNFNKNFHFYILIMVFILNTFFRDSIKNITNNYMNRHTGEYYLMSEFIKKNTNLHDTVLVWGADASLNYISKRKSSSKYIYQYPLYTPHYENNKMIDIFSNDIYREKPPLIIDASGQVKDKIIPLDLNRARIWAPTDPHYILPKKMRQLAINLNRLYLHILDIGQFKIYAYYTNPLAKPIIEKLKKEGNWKNPPNRILN